MRTQFINIFTMALLGSMLFSCGSGKEAASEAQLEMVNQLLKERSFEFRALWATPLSTQDMTTLFNAGLLAPGDAPNRINLMDNPNFLRIEGDSVSAYLPYYGEQQMHVSLNPADQGIRIDEKVSDLQVNYNERKGQYDIRFSASAGISRYHMILTVFPNLSATLKVNSSSREFISYQGTVGPIPDKEKNPG